MYGVVIMLFDQSSVYTFNGGGGGGGGGGGSCTFQPSVPEVAFEDKATMCTTLPIG